MTAFGEALGLLQHDVSNLHMFGGRLVKCGCDDLGVYAALHVGDFLGTFVDKKDDEVDFRMVGRNGVGHLF